LQITSQFPKPAYAPSAALAIGRSARIQKRIEGILDPSRNRLPLNGRMAAVLFLAASALTASVASLHEARGDGTGALRDIEAVANGSPVDEASQSQAVLPTQQCGDEPPANAGGAAQANDVTASPADRLSEIRTRILKSYVKSPDERLLDEGAIRG